VFGYAGWVYAYLIGNDISCGMGLWCTDLARNLAKLDRRERRLVDLDGRWSGDAAAWLADGGVAPTAYDLSLDTIRLGNPFADVEAVKQTVGAAAHRVHRLRAGSSAPASSGVCRPQPSRVWRRGVLRRTPNILANLSERNALDRPGHAAAVIGRHLGPGPGFRC
jgi:hypothetical protein